MRPSVVLGSPRAAPQIVRTPDGECCTGGQNGEEGREGGRAENGRFRHLGLLCGLCSAVDGLIPNPLRNRDSEAIRRVRDEAWPDASTADELYDALLWLGYLTERELDENPAWRGLIAALATQGLMARMTPVGLWIAAERRHDARGAGARGCAPADGARRSEHAQFPSLGSAQRGIAGRGRRERPFRELP
jgi:hypothetical protein